jgi:hypothetical protein
VRDQRRGSDTTVATVQNHRRHVALAALVAVVLTLGAVSCGDDSSSDDSSADTNTLATSDDTGDDTEESGDDTEEATDGDDAELTAEDICSMLTGDAVTDATGLEITEVEASESSTPQCAYNFSSENGPDSNLTVAATRYTSSDAPLEDAFASVVDVNLSVAGGTDVEQTDVDAGDEAVILSGTGLDLGILRVGNVLATLIVPKDTLTPDQNEALMVAIGNAFS